jgi:hypothetical protein
MTPTFAFSRHDIYCYIEDLHLGVVAYVLTRHLPRHNLEISSNSQPHPEITTLNDMQADRTVMQKSETHYQDPSLV